MKINGSNSPNSLSIKPLADAKLMKGLKDIAVYNINIVPGQAEHLLKNNDSSTLTARSGNKKPTTLPVHLRKILVR